MIIKVQIERNESYLSDNTLKNDIKYLICDYLKDNGLTIKETKLNQFVIIETEEQEK